MFAQLSSLFVLLPAIGSFSQQVGASPVRPVETGHSPSARDITLVQQWTPKPEETFWPRVNLFTQEKNNYAQPHNFEDQQKQADQGWWGVEAKDDRPFFFRQNYISEKFYLGYYASVERKTDMPKDLKGDERVEWQLSHNPWITGTPTLKVDCTISAKATTYGEPVHSTETMTFGPDKLPVTSTVTNSYWTVTNAVDIKLKPDSLPTDKTLTTGAVEVICTPVENKPIPKITVTAKP
ncbi:hypothetical protein IAT40_002216 [Kwoniella sp. CBS 6097]